MKSIVKRRDWDPVTILELLKYEHLFWTKEKLETMASEKQINGTPGYRAGHVTEAPGVDAEAKKTGE